jgi:hypothetical protein
MDFDENNNGRRLQYVGFMDEFKTYKPSSQMLNRFSDGRRKLVIQEYVLVRLKRLNLLFS